MYICSFEEEGGSGDASIDVHRAPSESITSFSNVVFNSGNIDVKVGLRKNFAFSGSVVHSFCLFEVLSSPVVEVSVGDTRISE